MTREIPCHLKYNFILARSAPNIFSRLHFNKFTQHYLFLIYLIAKEEKRGTTGLKTNNQHSCLECLLKIQKSQKAPPASQPHQSDPVGNPINPLVTQTQKAHLVDPRAFPPKEVN